MKTTTCVVLALAAAAALAAPGDLGPTRNARFDQWRVIGPGGGGTMRRPAISPHDPRVVLLGCDMTGGYVTADGGASWRMINFGSVPTAFAFDPTTPAVVYAGAAAVYRSEDAGRTWRMVLPDPTRNTFERAIGDHGDRVLFSDDPAFPGGRSVTVHAIAVDEDDSSHVFAALSGADSPLPGAPASPTLLVGSSDGGRRWSRLGTFASERIFALRSHGAGRSLHALGETGAYAGTAPQLQHFPAPGGARFGSGSLGRDPRSGVVFAYATAPLSRAGGALTGGVLASDDGGRSWHAANGALLAAVRETGSGEGWGPAKGSLPSVGPVAVSAQFPLEAYLGLRGLLLPSRGEKPFNGIAKTSDGGKTWSVVHAEADAPSANLAASWIEPRAAEDGHSVWFDSPVRPRRRAQRPRRRLRDRPVPHLPHGGRRPQLGAGELGSARRGPLDDARARRHDDVRHPVRPARPAARLHPLHGHRPLPQRRRRRDVDGVDDRHPARTGETRPTGSRSIRR